uniref:NADH-ubiquinone oxidoreductase chain 3 n=1 Tax=Elysia chlorotica TaxID=188477 RepID=B2D6J6_ELYCH|nr:NADH dehydrogenase subunit 3 [Elysia chlorotica]ACB70187.1 NADH dehydrogenase subunit 3 [Elysia chlorotica]
MGVIFSVLLSGVLLMLYFLTYFNMESGLEEKMTPFECGFDPLSKMRAPFSTRFFLLVVLFLIFDVEVALLFPVLSAFSSSSSTMILTVVLAFIAILLFGMFHEWNEGALDWVSG